MKTVLTDASTVIGRKQHRSPGEHRAVIASLQGSSTSTLVHLWLCGVVFIILLLLVQVVPLASYLPLGTVDMGRRFVAL